MTDGDGSTTTDTFYMLVRDLDKGVITEVNPMGALLEKARGGHRFIKLAMLRLRS